MCGRTHRSFAHVSQSARFDDLALHDKLKVPAFPLLRDLLLSLLLHQSQTRIRDAFKFETMTEIQVGDAASSGDETIEAAVTNRKTAAKVPLRPI